MLYNPNKYSYLKQFSISTKGLTYKLLRNYRFSLIATTFGLITKRQLESLRKFLARRLKKKHKLYCRFFLNTVLTRKASKVRMGKGSGGFDRWVGYIRPGTVLFDISNIKGKGLLDSNYLHTSIGTKLPFGCKFIRVDNVKY